MAAPAVSPSPSSEATPASCRNALPALLEAAQPVSARGAPRGTGWLYEAKIDGLRVLARIDGDDVRLFTAAGIEVTARLGPIADALRALDTEAAWLDGEIAVLDADGRASFQSLQNALDAERPALLRYLPFDLLFMHGRDLRAAPLSERRALLQALLERESSGRLLAVPTLQGTPTRLRSQACERGFDGVIAKRLDARYEAGRTEAWRTLECRKRDELVIGGYTRRSAGEGGGEGIGSLLLGYHDEGGQLVYAGSASPGSDERGLASLQRALRRLASARSPYAKPPRQRGVQWVRPQLVGDFSHAGWNADGRLRRAALQRLLVGRPAGDVVKRVATPFAPVASGKSASRESAGREAAPERWAGVRITHPQRVVDAASGATKLDLMNYHADIAERLLEQLAPRPVALLRVPQGLGHGSFFQKHAEANALLAVRRVPDPHGGEPWLQIDDAEGLLHAVQMNTIEFHTWNAGVADLAHPDRMTFDLDPGEGVSWRRIVEAARLVRAMLAEARLEGWLKTSGGKGLHIVVPLQPVQAWEEVRAVSHAIVRTLAERHPDRFVAKSGARNRVGRIFIDDLRNAEGATTVAAFSLRARPGLGASVPIAWDELDTLRRADQWNLRTLPRRLAAQKADPWVGYGSCKQTLDAAQRELASAGAMPMAA